MARNIPFVDTLPEHWKTLPNRYLFKPDGFKVGNKSSEYQLLSLTTAGVKEKDINATGGKVPESYDNYQTVKKGQMIFCLFDLDVSAVFSGISEYDGMITSAYDVYSNTELMTNEYADYWFKYVFSNRYYKMYSKSLRYTIASDNFKAIYTPVPPKDEQVRISKLLKEKETKIDSLIANEEKQIENLKTYKQTLITETVTKGLDKNAKMKDSGVKWIGEIPEDWELKPFKYILNEREEKNNPVVSEERLSLSIGLGVTLYSEKTTNLDRFKEEFDQYKLAYEGDLVMNSMNMIVGASGVSKYFGCVSPAYYVFFDNQKDHITSKYCGYLFRSKKMLRVLFSMGKGIYAIVRGDDRVNTCRLKVPKIDLRSMYLPFPTIEDQYSIVEYLDGKSLEIDKLISLKEKKIEKLNTYKKSLIYEYVTGKKEA